MMLIGTSLGGCLNSLLKGEVSEDDVLVIITRTSAPDFSALVNVVKSYYRQGNRYATKPNHYEFDQEIRLDQVLDLVYRLYHAGKIHQPRNFGHEGFVHAEMTRDALWMEVSPIGLNKHPAVIEAYEKYKVIDQLTK